MLQPGRIRPRRWPALLVEALERRELFSLLTRPAPLVYIPTIANLAIAKNAHTTLTLPATPTSQAHPNATSPPGNTLSPLNLRAAYGMNLVNFGGVLGDGRGQTIAIVDAYDYPTALTDVNAFSAQFGLPQFNQGGSGPTFQRVSQDGSQNFPPTDPAGAGNSKGTWETEAALDIQWAHVMAPGANIILVEASSSVNFPSYPLIQNAVNWARQQANVSVISMSFSAGESFLDSGLNQYLTTPSGHQGITFVASSGDVGTSNGYPTYAPSVVAVGGTSLTLNNGQYAGETAWSGSYGGISVDQSKPWYQVNVTQSATQRTAPDIALDADPNTGVAIYDSWDHPSSPWIQIGGTSLAAPLFAGMVAVANQGRAAFGLGTLDGYSQTLPDIYNAPAVDFHDITSGSNGTNSAGPGYDLVTGRGSPVANLLIPYMVGVVGSISGTVYQDNNATGIYSASDTPLAGVRVYVDANNNGVYNVGGTQTQTTGTINTPIPDNSTVGVANSLTVAGLAGAVSNITVNLSISHAYDTQISAYLIDPDGTKITLFSGVGNYSANFTNTTLSDQATASISQGAAPFSGSYAPQWPLLAFNGKSANGAWQLKVTDTGSTAALTNWSITVTTAAELSTVTAADGSYTLGPLAPGSQTVGAVLPPTPGFLVTSPTSQTYSLVGNMTGADFSQVLTTFNATGPAETFYLWVDQGKTAIGTSAAPVNPLYHLPAGVVPTFNLTYPACVLIVDYVNGSPLPAGGIQVSGGGLADSEVQIYGAGASLTMLDTQIGPAEGGVVYFTNLGTLSLWNSTVYYSGGLSTLEYLNVNQGTSFYWS